MHFEPIVYDLLIVPTPSDYGTKRMKRMKRGLLTIDIFSTIANFFDLGTTVMKKIRNEER